MITRQPMTLSHSYATGSNLTSLGGKSLVMGLAGHRLLHFGSAFTFKYSVAVATVIWDGFVARRTTRGSTTYLDSTTIYFGGVSNPSHGAGSFESDAITLDLSANYDYYIIGYVNGSTGGSAALRTGIDGGGITTIHGPRLPCGTLAGDQRAAGTMAATLSTNTGYGEPQWFTSW